MWGAAYRIRLSHSRYRNFEEVNRRLPNHPASAPIGARIAMGNDHRRHSKAELGALSLAPYYIRFITAGDPASDRGTFGDVATQPAQIGEALNNSTAGNATIAMRYDQKIRACATNYPNPERAHATSQSASGTESAHRARSRPRMWIGANRRAPQFGFGAVRRKSKRMGAAKTPSRGGKEERATAKFRGENDRGGPTPTGENEGRRGRSSGGWGRIRHGVMGAGKLPPVTTERANAPDEPPKKRK